LQERANEYTLYDEERDRQRSVFAQPAPAPEEKEEAPGVNPKYLGERALPEGLWKSATKGRYFVVDTNTGRKVRTDAKGNPLSQ
jgi:hypothetical protein